LELEVTESDEVMEELCDEAMKSGDEGLRYDEKMQ
jgi:hypothetical protein